MGKCRDKPENTMAARVHVSLPLTSMAWVTCRKSWHPQPQLQRHLPQDPEEPKEKSQKKQK